MTTGKQSLTFISYSRNNKDFAMELAKELKASGFSIWFDQLDIPTGTRWDDEIEKALERCDIFMVILTPSSITSNNVKDEIGYAIDSGKRILPILLKDANVPLRLRRFQYVNFTDISYNEGIDLAKQLLRKLIDEQSNSLPEPSVPVNVESQQPNADHSAELKAEANRLARLKAEAIRKAREQEQRERGLQATSQTSSLDRKPPSPQTQGKSSRGLIPLISGLAVVGILCLVGGFIAWPYVFPSPTITTTTEITITPSPTWTPSYTPNVVPTTATPTLTPSPTIQIIDPVQTIINYWNYRSIKKYDLAWEILSPSFQQNNHGGNFQNFQDSRANDNYCKIETTNGLEISNDGSIAIVNITVIYYVGACPGTRASHNFQTTLIFDPVSQSWRLDRIVEIKN